MTQVETRTWEEVLAAVEQNAARAAELLASAPHDAFVVAPAPPPILPALTEMPAVPEHLRERIATLRDRIDALSAELAEALRVWPGGQVSYRPAMAHVEPSRYLDQRV